MSSPLFIIDALLLEKLRKLLKAIDRKAALFYAFSGQKTNV
jgi:hypothetical protein